MWDDRGDFRIGGAVPSVEGIGFQVALFAGDESLFILLTVTQVGVPMTACVLFSSHMYSVPDF